MQLFQMHETERVMFNQFFAAIICRELNLPNKKKRQEQSELLFLNELSFFYNN